MKQRACFRILLLDGDRKIARVSIRRLGSNVVRLRSIPYRVMRHLANFQGVQL
jgi:hypothetical protein